MLGAYLTVVRHSLTFEEFNSLLYAYCWDPKMNADLGYRAENGACAYEHNGMLRFAVVLNNRQPKNGVASAFWTTLLLTRTEFEKHNRERNEVGSVIATINPVVFEGQERFNVTWDYRPRHSTGRSQDVCWYSIWRSAGGPCRAFLFSRGLNVP